MFAISRAGCRCCSAASTHCFDARACLPSAATHACSLHSASLWLQRYLYSRASSSRLTVSFQGLSLHTHALLKFQCLHTAAVLWAAHSSHALCDMLCERARATEGIASLRLGLHDALAQAAVSLRVPPITQLCPGNRSVLLGIAPLLWPLIMYSGPSPALPPLTRIEFSRIKAHFPIASHLKRDLLLLCKHRALPPNLSSSSAGAASRPYRRLGTVEHHGTLRIALTACRRIV
jgi:hypothetical protein